MTSIRLSQDWNADGWVLVPRNIMRDRNLSWKAKGIVAFMASHQEGFQVNRTFLEAAATDGKEALNSGLRELREAGYLTTEREHDEDGRFQGTSYMLHREPVGRETVRRETRPTGDPPQRESSSKRDQGKEPLADADAPEAATPEPELAAEAESSSGALFDVPQAKPAGKTNPTNTAAKRLADAYYDALEGLTNWNAARAVAAKALKAGHTEPDIRAALLRIADLGWTLTAEKLRSQLRGGPRPAGSLPPSPEHQPRDHSGRLIQGM